jgi:hypothetical protein
MLKLRSRSILTAICALAALAPDVALAQESKKRDVNPPGFSDKIRPFLETHCIDCHGPGSAKAGLRLDSLAPEFAALDKARIWIKVMDQLLSGEMPPKKKSQPAPADRKHVVSWIHEELTKADRQSQPPAGSLTLRRLTRLQYENTIHDLLAIEVPLKERLPEDKRDFGFDNIGQALNLSSAQLEVYLEAADAALDAAIVKKPRPETWKRRFTRQEVTGDAEGPLDLEDAVVLFGRSSFAPPLYKYIKEPGKYRFRLSVGTYQSKDPVELAVRYHDFQSSDNPVIGYFDAPVDAPTVIEFTFPMRSSSYINFSAHKIPYSPRHRDLKTYAGPGVAVQWLEVEGPLVESWPPRSHQYLFGELPLQPVGSSGKVLAVTSKQPKEDAVRLLTAFMRRAYRRPPNAGAIEPDIRGAKTIREQLDKHRSATACASCHAKFDPYGFALESFDVTGGWRDKYRILSGPNSSMNPKGPKVETDSTLPDGREFRDIDELKKLLIADKDQIARGLTEKLLIYSTGRAPRYSDREVVEEIIARIRAKNYGFRSLIHEVVQSRVFLDK